MHLTGRTNPYIPVTAQRHLVYALIDVRPDPGAGAAPLHLGLVVDASRSMSIPILTEAQFEDLSARGIARRKTVDGVQVWHFEVPRGTKLDAPSNMDFTLQALRDVADRLRAGDRFSLVAFAEDALLMVPDAPGTAHQRLREAIARLARVDLGDETYLARGMASAYDQLLAAQAHATAGAVARMVILTDGYTKDERACRQAAAQARAAGIVVSTMGLGLDFHEDLLISLAEDSGGHAYFAEDPADIPAILSEELSGAQSVAWRDLTLSLALPDDVSLRRVHRLRPTIAHIAANPDAIVLGDLETSQPPAILIELVVPARPAGAYRLAHLALHARPAAGGATHRVADHDLIVRYSERPSETQQTDPELMAAIQRVSAFKLHTQALSDAAQGNLAGATRRLRSAGERLIDLGQDTLGQTMLDEAQRLETDGEMSSEGTKRLRYGTRRLR